MNNKKLWYPAAMVIALSVAFGHAHAKSLEQTGSPSASVESLGNYGPDVKTKAGLKSILPTGWNLFIYKDTELPATISWNADETWLQALERFGDKNELGIRVDWNKQAVYISSLEVALQQKAKLADLDKVASTPLPAYSAAKPTPVMTAAPVAAATPAGTPSIAPRTQPAAAPISGAADAPTGVVPGSRISADLLARALAKTGGAPAQVMPATTSAIPAATPFVAQPAPQAQALYKETSASDAFAQGNLENIVRKAASKHGYQVSWETISLPLTGPVTFLGADPAEDMKLLQKSLGMRNSPIAVEVYRGSGLIRITANNQTRDPLSVYDSTYTGIVSYGVRTTDVPGASRVTEAPVQVATTTRQPSAGLAPVAVKTETSKPVVQASAPAPAPSALAFHMDKGESLSKALSRFLKSQNWELRWQVPNDMEAEFPLDITGGSVAEVLKGVLPKLGLDTDLYAPSRVAVIRAKDVTAD